MGSKTMAVLTSSTSTTHKTSSPRKRKAHSKSRLGCANCKIRRVKCDEVKPECKPCAAFGLACNYNPHSSSSTSASAAAAAAGPGELVLSFNRNGAFVMDCSSSPTSPMSSPRKPPVSMNKTMLGMINSALEGSPSTARFRDLRKSSVSCSSAWSQQQQQRHIERDFCCYSFKQADLDALHRFSHRSVLTFGTETAKEVLQRETPRLACLHPFLMHFVLTFTLMHDRLLQAPSSTNFTQREAFHYYTGTAQFNKLLQAKAYSTTLTPSERDACWIASTLLGLIYVAHIEVSTPEEAWPLQSPGPGEPDWLALNMGKNDMWEICDPLREDSCFRTMMGVESRWEDDATKFTPDELKEGGFPNLDGDILELLGLQKGMEDYELARASNPYYRAANIISQLMPLDYNSQSILKFTAFTHYTTPAFRALWGLKDPGALVLVLYWYAKAIPSSFWWLQKRAVLECQAVCIYLERYHSDVPHMDDILKFPKTRCGLLAAE